MTLSRSLLAISLALAPAAALADDDWPAPEAAKAVKSPVKADDVALAEGKKTYATKCQTCHGEKGLGDGKASGYLKEKPSDLSLPHTQAQSDGELYWRVSTGRKPMPGFADKLSDEARWQVVAYLRTLAAAPAADAK